MAHTPPGGWIRLRTRPLEDGSRTLVLEVLDSGPGIPREKRERVFDRFTRLPDAARPEGLGLGLPITRAIVRAHGGEIRMMDDGAEEVSSPAVARGAHFVVTLPIDEDASGARDSP